MSSKEASSQKSIGPITTTNPRSHTVVGVDGAGNWHHWHKDQDRLFVIGEDGELDEVKPMFGRELEVWAAFVAGRRGWTHYLASGMSAEKLFGDL